MTFRIVRIDPDDKLQTEEVRNIWRRSFTEDEEYLDRFFRYCYPYITTFGAESDGKTVSVLSFIEVRSATHKGIYLYGVATDPDYRGLNLSRKLFHEAKTTLAKDYEFIITRPAEDSLYRLYESMGFNCLLFRYKTNISLSVDQYISNNKENTDKTVEKILQIIEKDIDKGEILSFCNINIIEFAIKEIIHNGGKVFHDPTGNYIIADLSGKTVITNNKVKSENYTLSIKCSYEKTGRTIIKDLKCYTNNTDSIPEYYVLAMPLDSLKTDLDKLPVMPFLME